MCHVGPEKADRIGHSEGLNSIETAFVYVEQQRGLAATNVLLSRHRHDLTMKIRKKAQKQIPIAYYLDE
jgi:hypothetical protein